MATARKLPSGSWRVRVFDYKDKDGKKHYRSFTSDDGTVRGKLKAEELANKFMMNHEEKRCELTFGQACDEYISSRKSVCSVRTVQSYKDIKRLYLQPLCNIIISNIKQSDIQKIINDLSSRLSAKTVHNIHGLISAVLGVYRTEFALKTTLPKKYKPKLYIPSDSDIKVLLSIIKGTEIEVPVMLAAFGPMRRGEISALEQRDICGNTVCVNRNMVEIKDEITGVRSWIVKNPKSVNGIRYIEFPEFVAKMWEGKKGRIVDMTPDAITDSFVRLMRKHKELNRFRFHDLRHYAASMLHVLGMSDANICSRGGWDIATLNNIYKNALSDEQKKMDAVANEHFSQMYDTIYDTKSYHLLLILSHFAQSKKSLLPISGIGS